VARVVVIAKASADGAMNAHAERQNPRARPVGDTPILDPAITIVGRIDSIWHETT
jgi:hypothetical protein